MLSAGFHRSSLLCPFDDLPHVDDIPVVSVDRHAIRRAAARSVSVSGIVKDMSSLRLMNHAAIHVAAHIPPSPDEDGAISLDGDPPISRAPYWHQSNEEFHAMVEESIRDHSVDRGDCEPRYRAWVLKSISESEMAKIPTHDAILPIDCLPQRDMFGEPLPPIYVFPPPPLRRMRRQAIPMARAIPPRPLDLSRDSDWRKYLMDQAAEAGEHPLPATVLARYSCHVGQCDCEFSQVRLHPAERAIRRRASVAELRSQSQALSLVPVIRPSPALRPPPDITDPLHAFVESQYADLAEIRRRNRAKFNNIGALLTHDCSCCYRYVIMNKDLLGREEKFSSRVKGQRMHDQKQYDRMWTLLPDVMRDLLRKYNLEHGTQHDADSFPAALRRSLWICPACYTYLKREKWKKFPAQSMQNNLLLADVPPELHQLSHYERHLVARVRSFHQLLYLPFGQSAARGLCISYPSDTLTLVDSLPSTIEESDIVIIRQAPDNKSQTTPISITAEQMQQQDEQRVKEESNAVDESQTAPAAPLSQSSTFPLAARPAAKTKVPIQFKVRPYYVKAALRWLVSENDLYRDIRITDNLPVDLEATQETRLLPDEEEDVDEDNRDDHDDDVNEPAGDSPHDDQPPERTHRYNLRPRRPKASTPSVGVTESSSSPDPSSVELPDPPIDHVTQQDPTPMLEPHPIRERLMQIGVTRNAVMQPIMQIQRASGKPVRINYQRASEALAYPGIFPTGDNHYGTFRAPLSTLQYFRSRLLAYRERCMQDPTYLFFAVNAVDWQQLESAVGIHFQMRTGTNRTALSRDTLRATPFTWRGLHDEAHRPAALTRAQLEQHARSNNEDRFIEESCQTFMQSMRGTLAYWNKCKRDLFSMIRILGPPTWFVTFSADEFGWIECLMSAGGLTRQQAEALTKEEKQELIAKNPDLVSQYFDYRWSKFFNLVLNDKDGAPLGRIVDHFWRIEFQRRGSPHVHMLLWIKDAPRADLEADKPKVADFIARHVSTQIPQEPGELRDLVLRLQQHTCTLTCTRTKKGTVKKCRFNFPRKVCERTRMVNSDDRGLPKRTIYLTQRGPADVHTNAYNPELLLAWRGNMDVQYIASLQGVVAYVSAYMTKDEPEGFRLAIQNALSRLPPEANKRMKMMRMGATILSKRELPAQEACYRLLGLALRDSSRTFVTLNTRPEEHRTRVLKPRWREEADDSTDLFQMGVIQRYMIRPKGRIRAADGKAIPADEPTNWEEMTLAHFAANYIRVDQKKAPRLSQHNQMPDHSRMYCLLDGVTWIKRSSKLMIIQAPSFTSEKDGQTYYYSLLMLHIPFRKESDLLQGQSPLEAFCARAEKMSFADQSRLYKEQLADEIQRAMNQLHIQRQNGTLDVNTGIIGATDMEARAEYTQEHAISASSAASPNGMMQFRDLLSFVGDDDNDEYPNYLLNRDDFIAGDDAHLVGSMADDAMRGMEEPMGELGDVGPARLLPNPNPQMAINAYDALVASLNIQQRAIFNQVKKHTNALYRNGLSDRRASGVPPLRIFISGGGGTGKSHLLKAIREHILMATNNRGCVVCAPTGVAAFNVGGRTVHGLLSIPVDQHHRQSALVPPLRDELLMEKVEMFQDIDYLIIDEISMVSQNLLCKINARLNQIMCKGKAPPGMDFGGLSVIFVGDLYQLKPIQDSYIFDQCIHLWRQFTLNELTANVRQSGDPAWSALLERIRVGDTSMAATDVRTLRSRLTIRGCSNNIIRRPIDDEHGEWKDALRIYHTRKQVEDYNKTRTEELKRRTRVFDIAAEHTVVSGEHHGLNNHLVPKDWIPATEDDCGGLIDMLKIGVGSRVMLRRNISVAEGLVNGATGTVVSFDWELGGTEPQRAGEMPAGVNVLFDDKRVGAVSQAQVQLTADAPRAPVRIEPRFSRFDGVGGSQKCQIQRRQVPLILCWAATVHKVQGLTLGRAVIDLQGAFTNASCYVALSRVGRMENVALCSLATVKKIYRASPAVTKEYDRLRVLMTRLPQLNSIRTPKPNEPKELHTSSDKPKQKKRKKKAPSKKEWTVESIIGKSIEDEETWFLVKWLNWDSSFNTWEPRRNLTRTCERLILDFNRLMQEKNIELGPDRVQFVLTELEQTPVLTELDTKPEQTSSNKRRTARHTL